MNIHSHGGCPTTVRVWMFTLSRVTAHRGPEHLCVQWPETTTVPTSTTHSHGLPEVDHVMVRGVFWVTPRYTLLTMTTTMPR